MAKVKITGHASGTGVVTVTAPNTSTDRTITLPDATGTLLNSDGDGSSLTNLPSTSTADIRTAALLQITATSNIGLGANAVDSITTGDYNVGIGDDALTANTEGSWNTGIGTGSLIANTTGTLNTSVGRWSLYTNVTGSNNTAIGNNTLKTSTVSNNTAVGYNAMKLTTTGANNTAVGHASLTANTTGYENIALGKDAMLSNTTGFRNTSVGFSSMNGNTTGENNTALGRGALEANTTASNNTAVGRSALTANTTGAINTAVGYQALDANTTGTEMVALGKGALTANTTGNSTVAIGTRALETHTTGGNNIAVGTNAGRSDSPSGNLTTQSNRIVLGNNDITHFYCKASLTATSDKRDKADITASTIGLSFVNKLKPVTYKWDERSKYVTEEDINTTDLNTIVPDGTHKKDAVEIGFLAQDVEETEEEYGHRVSDKTNLITDLTGDGKHYSLKYERLIPILTKAIQELSTKNDALEARITALES